MKTNLAHAKGRRIKKPIGIEMQPVASAFLPNCILSGVIQFKKFVSRLFAKVLEARADKKVDKLIFNELPG